MEALSPDFIAKAENLWREHAKLQFENCFTAAKFNKEQLELLWAFVTYYNALKEYKNAKSEDSEKVNFDHTINALQGLSFTFYTRNWIYTNLHDKVCSLSNELPSSISKVDFEALALKYSPLQDLLQEFLLNPADILNGNFSVRDSQRYVSSLAELLFREEHTAENKKITLPSLFKKYQQKSKSTEFTLCFNHLVDLLLCGTHKQHVPWQKYFEQLGSIVIVLQQSYPELEFQAKYAQALNFIEKGQLTDFKACAPIIEAMLFRISTLIQALLQTEKLDIDFWNKNSNSLFNALYYAGKLIKREGQDIEFYQLVSASETE